MPAKSGKNIKLLVVGSTGRMGQEILQLCGKEKGFTCLYGISSGGPAWSEVDPKRVDLVIDFSNPTAFEQALAWSVKNKRPFLSGTTGLKPAHFKKLKLAGRTIPVLWASNMSLGIATIRSLLPRLRGLSDWSFQLEEAHHRFKKDKPSGTALTLQGDLSGILGRKLPPIISVRGGATPGIHKITARSKEEVIVIEHTALNRTVFARGALVSARWLFDKKRPGLYELGQILSTEV